METNIQNIHNDLVKKSKTGDRHSQYQLYELYVDAMYNVSFRMVGIKEDAEDVVQDSFIEAFKNLHTYKYQSTFGSWLKRIVINKSINHLKVKRIPITPIENHEFHLQEENIEPIEKIDLHKVKKGIETLPNGYKQIINLYLLEGYDHNEIGEILEISTSTSKSQYHRAKKKLIEIIKEL
ncbi:RNA polymerase sigma factor [uncultured Maribacter sp.]|uniref:RNA polymerase sigma factor n=1 Tax=uncultured Maribacter sp. TaxID=431308 RepID=UPI002638DBE2|nr:RNA polymerase sigma factor [uncultured Maribacter sp.]